MDVRTAVLYGILKVDIYMVQPLGFKILGSLHKVCKLLKSLYGLKQSSRAWYDKIDSSLRGVGLKRSSFDPNLYYLHKGQATLLVLLYVDDLFLTGNCLDLINWIKTYLRTTFDMTDLGTFKKYLGITFEYLPQGIFLHQRDYALSIV